jgi:FkbM family methyltransferase
MDRADGSLTVISDCRYGRMMYLANDRYVGHALAQHGEYSESEVALWRSFLEPHWIAVDVGANIGAHTIALARMVERVIAFEPLTYLYHMLCGSVALNGLTNVQAFNLGVGAAPGQMRVPYIDYTQTQAYGGWAPGFTGGKITPVAPLDDILPCADFLKIDVEGMELDVLQGAERILRESEPVLYLEASEGPKQQPLIQFLRARDYYMWWHIAPHYNPQNFRGNATDDLPSAPAPAILASMERYPYDNLGLERVIGDARVPEIRPA